MRRVLSISLEIRGALALNLLNPFPCKEAGI
jgi:hypothetical protein